MCVFLVVYLSLLRLGFQHGKANTLIFILVLLPVTWLSEWWTICDLCIYIYFFTSLSDLHNQNEIVRNPETSALNGTEEENATLANGFQFDGMENVLTVNKIK